MLGTLHPTFRSIRRPAPKPHARSGISYYEKEVLETLANPRAIADPQPVAGHLNSIQRLVPTRTAKIAQHPLRIFDAPAPLRLWHLTSLDAPTVAVVWTVAFAWAANVALPAWVPILLALSAWAVYIGDRLLDAYSALRSFRLHQLRLRHRFHWRHRRIFIPIAIAAACAAAFIVFFAMPLAARERDSVLAAATLVYFTRVHSNRANSPFTPKLRAPFLSSLVSKEMLVGLIFTTACALPTFSRATFQPSPTLFALIVPTVFFALLAWLNCRAIEHWECRASSLRSSAISFSGVSFPALALSVTGLFASAILASAHPRPALLILAGAVSALLLALLDRLRTHLTPLAIRAAADLVLLTPALLTPALLTPIPLFFIIR
jgi:uncharacterized membrane protein YesL